jgi:hypothetical protein
MNIKVLLKLSMFRDRVPNWSISYQWTKDFIELGFIYNSEKAGTRYIQGLIIATENAFRHLDQKYKTPTDF